MARFDDVLDEGVRLFRMGYFAVPCQQYEKHPCFTKWNSLFAIDVEGYVEMMEDLSQKRAWRGYDRRSIQWNFAVTCNTGVFILDIDAKPLKEHEDTTGFYLDENGKMPMGDELLRYLEERFDLSRCPMSRTQSGGYHLYFRAGDVDWSKFKQDQRLQGPDGKLLLDGRNPSKGCCIEWPTPGYSWIRALRPLEDLPAVPETLLEWIPRNEPEAARKPYRGAGGNSDYSTMKRLDIGDSETQAVFYETWEFIKADPKCSMAEGERNHNLLRVCNIAYSGAGLSEDLTRTIATEWANRAGFNDRGAIEYRVKAALDWIPPEGFRGFIRRRLGMR